MLEIADIKEAADSDETPEAATTSIYKLDDNMLSGNNLLQAKYDYDETGIYVPYTAKYQRKGCKLIDTIWYDEDKHEFHTEDNIFLRICRIEETKKAILIKCTWTRKAEDGKYLPFNSFNIECTWGEILDEYAKMDAKGNIKSNKLNQKASMTGRDSMLPASKGSYVSFIDDMRKDILLAPCLEVFKIANYEWPEIPDEDEDDDHAAAPSCFNEYPEDIQDGALYLINNNKLLDNIIATVSSIQYGNNKLKRKLTEIPATSYVKEPLHSFLNGSRGAGKTALILEILKNYPDKDVFHYQSFSAKNIYYDKDKFNPEGINIIVIDDPNLESEDKVETLKALADNTKKVKTLHTVIKQKAVEFQLTGKFLIIITYANEIANQELANRLHDITLEVEDNEKPAIKNKIKANTITDINDNAAVMKMREYNKAAIQYLSEKCMKIFNPFALFLKVDESENRDIPDLISLIITNSFFNYSNLKSIDINGNEVVIGSYADAKYHLKEWSKDKYQSYKLSHLHKKILKLLPVWTDDEAENKVREIISEIEDMDSEPAKTRAIESKYYTVNRLVRETDATTDKVRHALVNNHKDNTTTKSLIEQDLVKKIQIVSETYRIKPNIFYIPKDETTVNASIDDDSIYVSIQNVFEGMINTVEGKRSILINILIYANIVINTEGCMYLKKYCNSHAEDMHVDDYDSYYDFIANFINGLDEGHCIDVDTASIDDLMTCMHEMEKINTYISADISDGFAEVSNIPENDLNENQSKNNVYNNETNALHTSELTNKEQIKEMGYSYMYVQKLSEVLHGHTLTPNEVLSHSYYNFDMWPDDPDTDSKVLQLVALLKKLAKDDLITSSMDDGTKKYMITEEQYDFINGGATA